MSENEFITVRCAPRALHYMSASAFTFVMTTRSRFQNLRTKKPYYKPYKPTGMCLIIPLYNLLQKNIPFYFMNNS